jgi:hypothetical protein
MPQDPLNHAGGLISAISRRRPAQRGHAKHVESECPRRQFGPSHGAWPACDTIRVTAGGSRFIRNRCSFFRRCRPVGVMYFFSFGPGASRTGSLKGLFVLLRSRHPARGSYFESINWASSAHSVMTVK